MRTVKSGVMPDPFQSVVFRRIGREVGDLHIFAVIREPFLDVFVFVVGSIVLDEIDFPGIIASQDLFEILDVSVGVEYFLEVIEEPRAV